MFLTGYEDPRLISSSGQQLLAEGQDLIKNTLERLTKSRGHRPSPLLTEDDDCGRSGQDPSQLSPTVESREIEQQITRIAQRLGISRKDGKNILVGTARAYSRLAG